MEREDKFILRWSKRYRAFNELGGKCVNCGETNIFLMDFHHLDQNTKEYGISKLSSKASWDELKLEIDKCVLLCSNCHRLHHLREIEIKFNNNIELIIEKSKTVDEIKRPKLDDNYIYDMLLKEFSLNFIAKSINKDVSTIRDVAIRLEKLHGVKLIKTRNEYNKSVEKITEDDLVKLYNDGYRAKEIAEMYQMCKSTLFSRIKKLKTKKILK
jgi:hypothetical protein